MRGTLRRTLARCIEVYWTAVRQEWGPQREPDRNARASDGCGSPWGPFAWAADRPRGPR